MGLWKSTCTQRLCVRVRCRTERLCRFLASKLLPGAKVRSIKLAKPVELMFVVLIIVFTVGLLAPHIYQITQKTRSTEGGLQLRSVQARAVEDFAFAGVLNASVEDSTSQGIGKNAGVWTSTNGIVFATQPTFGNALLAYEPSVIQGEPAGSMQWNCGANTPQPGWSGKIAPHFTTMRRGDMPHTCRHGGR